MAAKNRKAGTRKAEKAMEGRNRESCWRKMDGDREERGESLATTQGEVLKPESGCDLIDLIIIAQFFINM